MPLVAPALIGDSPFYVLLFYWSFRRLPRDLFDAARLEGLGPLAIWWRVALPLVRPVAVAVGVLAFVFSWSNFLDPLIYLFDDETSSRSRSGCARSRRSGVMTTRCSSPAR